MPTIFVHQQMCGTFVWSALQSARWGDAKTDDVKFGVTAGWRLCSRSLIRSCQSSVTTCELADHTLTPLPSN